MQIRLTICLLTPMIEIVNIILLPGQFVRQYLVSLVQIWAQYENPCVG